MKRILFLAVLLTGIAAPTRAQDQSAVAEGARLWAANCTRCHNARSPAERTDRQWTTIANHMRARANMTRTETERIIAYLQAINLPPATVSSVAVPIRAGFTAQTATAGNITGSVRTDSGVESISVSEVTPSAATTGRVVVVKMVDKSTAQWRFEPATVTVRPGDTIRWIQEDIVPHNVEFRDVPESASLGDATMGPYVIAKGDVYELEIDQRFVDGLYNYVCTPHEPLGMRASFTVDASAENADVRQGVPSNR